MNIRKLLMFIAQAVVVGLAAAFLLLMFKPGLMQRPTTVVEVQSPTQQAVISDATGPVSYAQAVNQAAPAVVNIHTAKVITARAHPFFSDPLFQQFFGDHFSNRRKQLQTSLGSGVIISTQGYVLTNHHVVDGADEIQVMLQDGRSARAQVVGTDPDTDLAVLKITLPDVPVMVVGDSTKLSVGDVVLAIGNPFGVGQTVTMGIVSATGRNQLGINTYENFIQTDAAINPGNSGGALVNAFGHLVGINTAIFSKSGGSQGIGFAIPVSLAKDVMTQIIEHGQVVRGWLGIEAQDITAALAQSFGLPNQSGVLIAGVLRGGPADLGGLEPGDVVTTMNGDTLLNARDAMNRIAMLKPDDKLLIEGLRQGKKFKANIHVTQRPLLAR